MLCLLTLDGKPEPYCKLSKRMCVDVSDLLLFDVIHKASTLQLQIDAVCDDESSGVTN